MIASLRLILEILSIGAAFGFGPYCLLARGYWRHPVLGLPLMVSMGLGLITVVAVNIIYLNVRVGATICVAIVCSLLCLLWSVRSSASRKRSLPGPGIFSWRVSLYQVALVSGCIGALWPSVRFGGAQPYRIGIDEIGYAVTGQFLMDGGTRSSLEKAIVLQTGMPSLDEALIANVTALDFNINTATEFILKSQRCGYPGLLAVLALMTNVSRVIDLQFLVLIAPLWLIASTVSTFLLVELSVGPVVAFLWGVALAFNSNLLNVAYEGQHAQLYAEAFGATLFIAWWCWRRERKIDLGSALFPTVCFVFAVIMASYSEELLLLFILGFVAAGIDLVCRRNIGVWVSMLVAAGVIGSAFTGMYLVTWVPFIVKHTINVSGGGSGFWQPQWATVLDILGFINIYQISAPNFVGRTTGVALVFGVMSLLIVDLMVIAALLKRREGGTGFWLAPIVLITVVFAKSVYVDRIHNYNYMKTYTLLLFPLVIGFVSALVYVTTVACERCQAIWKHRVRCFVVGVPALWIICVGLSYVKTYQAQARFAPSGASELGRGAVAKLVRDNVILTLSEGGMGRLMLSGYVELNWLNLGWADPYLVPHEGKKILLLALKEDLANPGLFREKMKGKILFESRDLILADTGLLLSVPDSQKARKGMVKKSVRNLAGNMWPLEMMPLWHDMVTAFAN